MAGALGFSESDLWETSPRYLIAAYEGRIENEEISFRTNWETARFISTSVLNSQGAKIKNPTKLMQFDWEKPLLSKQDIRRLKQKFENGVK